MLKALVFLGVCVYYSTASSVAPPLFRHKRSGDTCHTTPDSKDPGAKCIFPFKFKGETYHGCPPDLGDPTRGWCSTKTDSDGNHVSGEGKFGYCGNSCPTHSEKATLNDVSCKCKTFSSCPWSKSMVDEISGLPNGHSDRQTLAQKFQTQICNKKNQMVWCCGEGKPNSELELLSGNLVSMESEDADLRSVDIEHPSHHEHHEHHHIEYYPTSYKPLSTGAGCSILWKESVEIEHRDIKTTVCTTVAVHACIDKTVEECKFIEISIPFTEVIDECVTEEIKSCTKAWACLDDGWTKDKDTSLCQNEEYQDSDNCITLPKDVCTKKEVTIEVKEKKRECKDIPYKDCGAKVPTQTCEEDHVRIPTTFKHMLPFKVCGSD